jgi:hypothetical protein
MIMANETKFETDRHCNANANVSAVCSVWHWEDRFVSRSTHWERIDECHRKGSNLSLTRMDEITSDQNEFNLFTKHVRMIHSLFDSISRPFNNLFMPCFWTIWLNLHCILSTRLSIICVPSSLHIRAINFMTIRRQSRPIPSHFASISSHIFHCVEIRSAQGH